MFAGLPTEAEVAEFASGASNDTRAWADDARCHPRFGHDPELWFPEGNRVSNRKNPVVLAAKQVCMECPVRWECLMHGLLFEPYGIWGGLTETERDVYRLRVGVPNMLWRRNRVEKARLLDRYSDV